MSLRNGESGGWRPLFSVAYSQLTRAPFGGSVHRHSFRPQGVKVLLIAAVEDFRGIKEGFFGPTGEGIVKKYDNRQSKEILM